MKVEILGVDKTSLLEAGTLSVTRISNDRRTCNMDIMSAASSYIPGLGQDIKVYDDTNAVIFGGCIKKVATEQLDKGNSDQVILSTNIYSDGYNQIAERRAATAAYTTSYAGDIVTDLINTVLNSTDYNEGVGLGTIQSGAYFDTYNKSYATIKEMLDELAGASGFKWYIDDTKALNFVAETTTPTAAHSILSTGTYYDYFDFSVVKSMMDYRNVQVVVGAQLSSSATPILVSVESSAQIAAQQTIEGGSSYSSGVYANIIRDSNINSVADANTVADNALKQHGLSESIRFKSYATDWQPGTKLLVKLPKYGVNDNTYYLIEEVTYDKINANELVASITATKRDEADFSSQKTEDEIDYINKIVSQNKEYFERFFSTINDNVSYRGVNISAAQGFIATATMSTSIIQVVMNSTGGLSFYQDGTYRGGLKLVNGELVLETDILKDPAMDYAYANFEQVAQSPYAKFYLNFYAPNKFTGADAADPVGFISGFIYPDSESGSGYDESYLQFTLYSKTESDVGRVYISAEGPETYDNYAHIDLNGGGPVIAAANMVAESNSSSYNSIVSLDAIPGSYARMYYNNRILDKTMILALGPNYGLSLTYDSLMLMNVSTSVFEYNNNPIIHEGLPRFRTGHIDFDLASSSQTVAETGLGFQPRGILLYGTIYGTARMSQASFGDGSAVGNNMYLDDAGNYYSGTGCQLSFVASAGNYHVASLASFTSDGFQLTWTKTGSPTGAADVEYTAFR